MPLKKHSICVGWEDITTKELIAFHGVIFNMARRVKCSIKDSFSEQWLDSSWFYKDIFSRRDFCNYIGDFMPFPLLGVELQRGKCSPKLVK
jgi:hypothetical protein